MLMSSKYTSLSSYLLTNKALVYPLKYKNKREQFHPYTVAKTMKSGWRWITQLNPELELVTFSVTIILI